MTGERQREHRAPQHHAVIITESEWRSVMLGARAFREAAAGHRQAGASMLAAENEEHAATLEQLGRRAEVAAARDLAPDINVCPQAYAELEAER